MSLCNSGLLDLDADVLSTAVFCSFVLPDNFFVLGKHPQFFPAEHVGLPFMFLFFRVRAFMAFVEMCVTWMRLYLTTLCNRLFVVATDYCLLVFQTDTRKHPITAH